MKNIISLLLWCVLSAIGCASAPRFVDRPVVWRVDDARDIPEPEENVYRLHVYFADIFLLRRSSRALSLPSQKPAMSTNALDEVPSSTWFTNRIGMRDLTPEEAARGPSTAGPPELPLTVIGGKVGGGNPGFMVRDKAGRKFLVKFDVKENPEMQTATDAIAARIFWAAGYNTPADYVVEIRREDVLRDEKANIKDSNRGEKRAMVDEDIDSVLATAPAKPDGGYRALASELLPGKPVGGFAHEGLRDDDPNDTIPHQHRRELRGLLPLAAWLNHTDMKEDNTLDMYVEEDGRKFIRHYLVDFGEAFAAHAAEKGRYEDGFEHFWDWSIQPRALLAFGLWKRPWEDLEDTQWPAIGAFESKIFQPELYKPAYPYFPFFEADAADRFWGAKLVMRFDRKILEAIIAEGKISDPAAAAYLLETLIERRDKVGRTWIEAVTPLDQFKIRDKKLCATDLGVHYGFARRGALEVLAEGSKKVVKSLTVARTGEVCVPLRDAEGYQVYRLRTRRDSKNRPIMQVHVIQDATPRIVGLIRLEGQP